MSYDGEGNRVKKQTGTRTTTMVYGVSGQLVEEYDTAPATETDVRYLAADHLGSTRMVFNQSGTATACLDYVPFGEQIPQGMNGRSGACWANANEPRQKFTGKERDAETGLDYFLARYYSGAMGRFTTVDPLMASADPAIPQSWNRYSYVLNRPLTFIDPTGELWVSTGNIRSPYSWVDRCEDGQQCYDTVAAVVNGNLAIYGSLDAQDIQTFYSVNGLINVNHVSRHGDAEFESIQTRGQEENYLAPAQAAALFNVAEAYSKQYSSDNLLVFTGGSTAAGESAIQPRQSHRNGLNIDMRYMDANGASLQGAAASGSADVGRTQFIANAFARQNAGLAAVLTGTPERFGYGPLSQVTSQRHRNHMHFQRTYPPRPRVRR